MIANFKKGQKRNELRHMILEQKVNKDLSEKNIIEINQNKKTNNFPQLLTYTDKKSSKKNILNSISIFSKNNLTENSNLLSDMNYNTPNKQNYFTMSNDFNNNINSPQNLQNINYISRREYSNINNSSNSENRKNKNFPEKNIFNYNNTAENITSIKPNALSGDFTNSSGNYMNPIIEKTENLNSNTYSNTNQNNPIINSYNFKSKKKSILNLNNHLNGIKDVNTNSLSLTNFSHLYSNNLDPYSLINNTDVKKNNFMTKNNNFVNNSNTNINSLSQYSSTKYTNSITYSNILTISNGNNSLGFGFKGNEGNSSEEINSKFCKSKNKINSSNQNNLLNNCQESCEKASNLQKKMNKNLFNTSNLGKTYEKIKLKQFKKKIDFSILKNIHVEKEEKGLFIYGNNKKERAHFVSNDETSSIGKLDNIQKMDDLAIYRVRNVLMQRFGISIGAVKKKIKLIKNNNFDKKHSKVKYLLDNIYDKNNSLLKRLEKNMENKSKEKKDDKIEVSEDE